MRLVVFAVFAKERVIWIAHDFAFECIWFWWFASFCIVLHQTVSTYREEKCAQYLCSFQLHKITMFGIYHGMPATVSYPIFTHNPHTLLQASDSRKCSWNTTQFQVALMWSLRSQPQPQRLHRHRRAHRQYKQRHQWQLQVLDLLDLCSVHRTVHHCSPFSFGERWISNLKRSSKVI